MINWDLIEEEMGGKFKSYLPEGEFETKCSDIEIKEVGSNGSVIMKFTLDDIKEGKFPSIDHWMSFKNDNFRQWHNKCLMVVLGASEDAAKKAVEVCESKDGKENIMKAYEQAFKKLLAKKPTVKVEVYADGQYSKSEFLDKSVAFPHGEKKEEPKEDVLDGAEEVDLGDDSLPF